VSEFLTVPSGDGVTRQILADHPDLMVVQFSFEAKGAEGTPHNHPHSNSQSPTSRPKSAQATAS